MQLTQIELTIPGVLKHFSNFPNQQGAENTPSDGSRDEFISNIVEYSNKSSVNDFTNVSDKDLIGYGATIVFLFLTGIQTESLLKGGTLDDHRNSLIVNNQQHTHIPTWRLQALDNGSLVQIGLLWYTKIDFTVQGLLSLLKVQPDPTKDPWATVVELLTHFSNEDQSVFAKLPKAVLLGKLGLIAFLIRWKYSATPTTLKTLSTAQQRQLLVDENYWRTGIAYQFLSGEVFPEHDKKKPPVPVKLLKMQYQRTTYFSDKELVNLALGWYVINKPYATYKDVSWILAHDSFTGDKKYLGGDASRDQDRNIEEQLASGVRAVRISTDSYGDLDHGGITKFGTIGGYLQRVGQFLKDNPKEIVTIIDESNDWTDTINDAYNDNLKDYLFTPKDANITDPQNTWPTLADVQGGKLPSIKDMVSKNSRVIVLHNADYDTKFPWRLHSYDGKNSDFLLSMDLDNYGLDEGYDLRPPFSTAKNPDKQRWSDQNHLYLINHYFYMKYLSHDSSSRAWSRRWGNSELAIEYAMLSWWRTGRKPNFIHADFYDLPNIFNNFIFDLAIGLNRPDAFSCFELPYIIDARKPVLIMDTIVGGDGLRLGQTYTITCMAGKYGPNGYETYNIARVEDRDGAAVQLAPSNASDVKQQWKIVYNTPETGFALTSPDGYLALYDPNWADPDLATGPQNALIVKVLQGNQRGAGFAMQGSCLYKSNMRVGSNIGKSDLNNYTQLLSLWQAAGTGNYLDNDFDICRSAKNTNGVDNRQAWKFTRIDSNPAPSDWDLYANQSPVTANAVGQLPDDNGWHNEYQLLEQIEAFAVAHPDVTYFAFESDSILFCNDLQPQLGSSSQNTYILKGYKET